MFSKIKFVNEIRSKLEKIKVFLNFSKTHKLFKINSKLIDISIEEKSIVLKQKNGTQTEFLISDINKIHIEVNKRSHLNYLIIIGITPFIVFLYLETYLLFLTILLYANLVFLIIYNFTHHKFKFKLIIKDLELKIHYFEFDYKFKNIITESISRINYLIKP